MQDDADALEGEATGSMHRLEAMAERAKKAEAKAERQRARAEANVSQHVSPPSPAESIEMPDGEVEEAAGEAWPSDVHAHEWLVE